MESIVFPTSRACSLLPSLQMPSKPSLRQPSSFRISGELLVAKQRRSASYHPTIWETSYIKSFKTPYSYKLHGVRLEELKQSAKWLLKTTKDSRALLMLLDMIQRLGIAYHFEAEIDDAVSLVHRDETVFDDLYTSALKFRILREHRRPVGSEVFDRFRGKDGKFADNLSDDVAGLLSLFEATQLGVPGEDVLDVAEGFAARMLRHSSGCLWEKQVEESLEVPLHWKMPRLGARGFIDHYQLSEDKSPTLLELAKLDYNLVQSVHQEEVKVLALWWRDLGFKENLQFARDRLMENYLWAMGITYEPRFSKCRVGLTKFVCILTAIDDIYDIYGSLDELESFTKAVKRWDIEAMEHLPHYMKICYLAMLNFGNEVIYDVLTNHGLDVSKYIKGEWLKLCKSYLVEARWFNSGHTPTLQEYLGNALTSVGGPAAMVHACVLSLDNGPASKAMIESRLHSASNLIHCSSLITRLSDDLGTSEEENKRGDVTKSIECHMAEKGVSREKARGKIRGLIRDLWKAMNGEVITRNESLSKPMVKMCLNMARTAQCIFQQGDGIGTSTGVTKDLLSDMIVKHVPL